MKLIGEPTCGPTIALLLACDYIYMLKDWELSKGAKLELDVASSCGIKVLFE